MSKPSAPDVQRSADRPRRGRCPGEKAGSSPHSAKPDGVVNTQAVSAEVSSEEVGISNTSQL